MFGSQILIAYSLLLFLPCLEVQSKCKNYKVYFGRSKYVFEQCSMKTRLIGNKETTVKGANFLVQWYRILIWHEKDFNKYIVLAMKTWCSSFINRNNTKHNPLLKPFTFCTIFDWFGINEGFPDWVITLVLTLFDNNFLLADLFPPLSSENVIFF